MTSAEPKEKKLRILVITQLFPPFSSSSTHRWKRYTDYLASHAEVTVLTSSTSSVNTDSNLSTSSSLKEIYRVPFPEKFEEAHPRFLWLKNLFIKRREGSDTPVVPLEANTDRKSGHWKRDLKLWYQGSFFYHSWAAGASVFHHARKHWAPGSFDLIIASFPSIAPLRAASRLSKIWGIPWIADFRDPGALRIDPADRMARFLRNRLLRQEVKCTESARKIIVLSQEMNPFVAGPEEKKFGLLTPRPDRMPPVSGDAGFPGRDSVCIRYFGAANRQTGIALFVEWMARIFREEEQVRGRLAFEFAGPEYDIAWLAPFCRELGLPEESFHYLGALPHNRALQLMLDSDLLLMRGESQYWQACGISGKFYEYALTGRPMLLVDPHDSSARERLMKKWRLGWHTRTYEQFREVILRMLTDRAGFEAGFASERDANVSAELSKEHLGPQLFSLINSVSASA